MSRQDTSSATKILWGQILMVSIVALLFVWAATQWVAFRLGFHPNESRRTGPFAALKNVATRPKRGGLAARSAWLRAFVRPQTPLSAKNGCSTGKIK